MFFKNESFMIYQVKLYKILPADVQNTVILLRDCKSHGSVKSKDLAYFHKSKGSRVKSSPDVPLAARHPDKACLIMRRLPHLEYIKYFSSACQEGIF